MKQGLISGLLTFFLLASSSLSAEVVYVADGVNVGVHQESALTSTILALVPAGTPLEVLEEKNGLMKVRLSDGTQGWVDGRYVTKDISPVQKADGLEAELVQTATELAKARELAAELEFQLKREKERARIMEADLLKARKELESKPANGDKSAAAAADALRKLRKAEEDNRRMNKRVAELETRLKAMASNSDETSVVFMEEADYSDDEATLLSRYTAITKWKLWEIMLLFFGLLLAFAVGAYLVDWEVRRRHGGFRV